MKVLDVVVWVSWCCDLGVVVEGGGVRLRCGGGRLIKGCGRVVLVDECFPENPEYTG